MALASLHPGDLVREAVRNTFPWGETSSELAAPVASPSIASQVVNAPSQLSGKQEKKTLQSLSNKTVSAGGLVPEQVCDQPCAEVGGNVGK